jgi:hypothetical protein
MSRSRLTNFNIGCFAMVYSLRVTCQKHRILQVEKE